jgi:hypothetical protein
VYLQNNHTQIQQQVVLFDSRILGDNNELHVAFSATVTGARHVLLQGHLSKCYSGIQRKVFCGKGTILIVSKIRICGLANFASSLQRVALASCTVKGQARGSDHLRM